MAIEIVGLDAGQLEEAAGLVCGRYRSLRERIPVLPRRYTEIDPILENLMDLQAKHQGVAAYRERRMVGFMSGLVIPEFLGRRSAYSPEWANATAIGEDRRVYEAMYAEMALRWIEDGCRAHVISLMSNDLEGLDAWIWLGFGFVAADVIRDLNPVEASPAEVRIRRAGAGDIDLVTTFMKALDEHLAAPPIFWPHQTRVEEAWLSNPEHAMWMAYDGEVALGCMGFEPGYEEGCTILQDENTISISSAYTRKIARGRGVGTALLKRGMAWANERGYSRCALDFEAMNIQARRFWMRWFEPVCYSVMRVLDERAGEASREGTTQT